VPLEWYALGFVHQLCANVWADNFTELAKKSLGLFVMSSKLLKLNSKTECFLLRCQQSYVLRVVILRNGNTAKSGYFCDFYALFKTRWCGCRFIFMKTVPSSKKRGNLCQKNERERLKWMTMSILFSWHWELFIVTYNVRKNTPKSIFQITRGQWGTS